MYKKYIALAALLCAFSFEAAHGMVGKQADLLNLLSKTAGGKGVTAVFNPEDNNFDRWSDPAKFQYNVLSAKATLRLAKLYLAFICMLLESVPGSTVNDLPKLKNGADLKDQTQKALAKWNLDLQEVDGKWFIVPAGKGIGGAKGPEAAKTLPQAAAAAKTAVDNVVKAINAIPAADKKLKMEEVTNAGLTKAVVDTLSALL